MLESGRERLINTFVTKVFRGKSEGVSKMQLRAILKQWLKSQKKSWTSGLQSLLDATYSKKVPPEMLAHFKAEDIEAKIEYKRDSRLAQRIKPKTRKPFLDEEPSSVPTVITTKGKTRVAKIPVSEVLQKLPTKKPLAFKSRVSKLMDKSRFDEPEDVNDIIYDEPEFKLKPVNRTCKQCGESYVQNNAYPNRLSCPDCNKKGVDALTDGNFIYASTEEYTNMLSSRNTHPRVCVPVQIIVTSREEL